MGSRFLFLNLVLGWFQPYFWLTFLICFAWWKRGAGRVGGQTDPSLPPSKKLEIGHMQGSIFIGLRRVGLRTVGLRIVGLRSVGLRIVGLRIVGLQKAGRPTYSGPTKSRPT